jgi:hypothetical protein
MIKNIRAERAELEKDLDASPGFLCIFWALGLLRNHSSSNLDLGMLQGDFLLDGSYWVFLLWRLAPFILAPTVRTVTAHEIPIDSNLMTTTSSSRLPDPFSRTPCIQAEVHHYLW